MTLFIFANQKNPCYASEIVDALRYWLNYNSGVLDMSVGVCEWSHLNLIYDIICNNMIFMFLRFILSAFVCISQVYRYIKSQKVTSYHLELQSYKQPQCKELTITSRDSNSATPFLFFTMLYSVNIFSLYNQSNFLLQVLLLYGLVSNALCQMLSKQMQPFIIL